MSEIAEISCVEEETSPWVSEWKRFSHAFFSRKIIIAGLIVLGIMIFVAIFCKQLAPYNPNIQDLSSSLQQPSIQHWLGTDQYGRDTFSRLLYGARTALLIGFSAITLAAVIGITLGILSGYFGGVIDMIIMRIVDTLMSLPLVLLALLLASFMGGGVKNLILALSVATLPPFARIIHGQTLSIKENDYILAMRIARASNFRIIFNHILPNAFAPIMVQMTMQIGILILMEASLSFLGIGIQAPMAAWGSMVSDGYRFLLTNPVLSFAPGIAIVLVVFAFNIVGDGLIDALDPKLRGKL